MVVSHWPDETQPYRRWYHLGAALAMYVNWQFCTLVGIVAGTQLEGIADLGLDFAMVVTFVGITVPLIINRPMLACAIVAALVAVLSNGLPNRLGLMLAALAGIAAGLLVEMLQPGSDDETAVDVLVIETNSVDPPIARDSASPDTAATFDTPDVPALSDIPDMPASPDVPASPDMPDSRKSIS